MSDFLFYGLEPAIRKSKIDSIVFTRNGNFFGFAFYAAEGETLAEWEIKGRDEANALRKKLEIILKGEDLRDQMHRNITKAENMFNLGEHDIEQYEWQEDLPDDHDDQVQLAEWPDYDHMDPEPIEEPQEDFPF